MYVSLKTQYSIGDIIDELGKTPFVDLSTGIIPLQMSEKLFIGGGCEYVSPPGEESGVFDPMAARNISICVSGPIL